MNHHLNQDPCVKLSNTYTKLVTGEGVEDLVYRFAKRESEAEIKQRREISSIASASLCNRIAIPFNKLSRSTHVIKRITGQSDADAAALALQSLNGGKGVDHFMTERFLPLTFTDPNAIVMLQPTMLPEASREVLQTVEWSSEQILSRTHDVVGLSSFTVGIPRKVSKDEKTVRLELVIFERNGWLRLIPVDRGPATELKSPDELDAALEQGIEFVRIEDFRYQIQVGDAPVQSDWFFEVGYIHNESRGNSCFVNPFHHILARFEEYINAASQMQVSHVLHAFPRLIQYVQKCNGDGRKNKCHAGRDSQGKDCYYCKGKGWVYHHNETDALFMPLPDLKKGEELVDLNKILAYPDLPTDNLKEQRERLVELEDAVITDMYPSNIMTRHSSFKTATEVEDASQSVYDVLWPFSVKYSEVYMLLSKALLEFNGVFFESVVHSFPRDMKLKSTDMIINDMKEARDAGVDSQFIIDMQQDLASKIWQDDPAQLERYAALSMHMPFRDKTNQEVIQLMSLGLVSKEDSIRWANFDDIVAAVERRINAAGKITVSMPFDEREELFKEEVEKASGEISGTTAPLELPELDDDVPAGDGVAVTQEGVVATDVSADEVPINLTSEAEAKGKLRGAVGGVNAIVELNIKVGEGLLDREAAKNILINMYGYSEAEANSMIGPQGERREDA